MKGLILAGGRGTRLRPITHTSAKQLVPVANRPILHFGIDHLVDAGIREIGIVTGESGADIRASVGDGSRWGVAITYIDQPEPLGLAHAVSVARPFLGDDDVVVYLGDNLLEEGVAGFVERFAATGAAASILLSPVPDPRRFGVVELVDDRIVRIVEKPDHPPSDLALVGVYLFTAVVHEAIAHLQPSARGELEITEALQWLIDHDRPVHHELLSGWWLDTGKKDSVLEANQRVLETLQARVDGDVDDASTLEGTVVVDAGAVVRSSTVAGPAIIGAGCRIEDATIGPCTSIGAGSTIIGSRVDRSVLLDDVRIEGVGHLTDSLVGRASGVRGGDRDGRVRLLVGDHCDIDLGAP